MIGVCLLRGLEVVGVVRVVGRRVRRVVVEKSILLELDWVGLERWDDDVEDEGEKKRRLLWRGGCGYIYGYWGLLDLGKCYFCYVDGR